MTEEAEAIEQVAEKVAGEVVADIIAEANERADERGALATEIMDAALESERGREIASIREGLAECQTVLAELPGMLAASLADQLTGFRAELTAAMETTRADCLSAVADALASLNGPTPEPEPNPSASTPPTLTEEVQPEALTTPAPEPAPAPSPQRRKNLFR